MVHDEPQLSTADAHAQCQANGEGGLIEIGSQAEQDYINGTVILLKHVFKDTMSFYS